MPTGTQLVTTLLLGVLTIVITNVLGQVFFRDRRKPPVVFHLFPGIGSTVQYGQDPYAFFFECREKVRVSLAGESQQQWSRVRLRLVLSLSEVVLLGLESLRPFFPDSKRAMEGVLFLGGGFVVRSFGVVSISLRIDSARYTELCLLVCESVTNMPLFI